jgi:hypothetical protein
VGMRDPHVGVLGRSDVVGDSGPGDSALFSCLKVDTSSLIRLTTALAESNCKVQSVNTINAAQVNAYINFGSFGQSLAGVRYIKIVSRAEWLRSHRSKLGSR